MIIRNHAEVGWQLGDLDPRAAWQASAGWDRPREVSIVGSAIRWRYITIEGEEEEAGLGWPQVRYPVATPPGPEMLASFANLSLIRDRPPKTEDEVLGPLRRFASTWGVLHLCPEHQLPRTHLPLRGEVRHGQFCGEPVEPLLIGSEPIAGWLAWSGIARALLNIAARLRRDPADSGDPADWDVLMTSGRAKAVGNAATARRVLGGYLSTLGLNAGIGLVLNLDAAPRVRLGGGGLFGAIVIQLMLAASAARGIAFCDECARAYEVKRNPRPTGPSYCSLCRYRHPSHRRAQAKWTATHPDYHRSRRAAHGAHVGT